MHWGAPWNQFVLEATRNRLKSVSALANTEGGALYFGVSNDGTVTGLKDIQTDSDFISKKINAHLNKLQKDGYLERIEGRKTGRWKVLIKK